MKLSVTHRKSVAWVVGIAITMLARDVYAQQVPIPTTAAEVSGPVSGTALTTEFVQTLGRTAYFWGYALVSASSRRHAFSEAPGRIYLGGTVPMAPIGDLTMLHDYISPSQTFIVCPNQME